MNTGKWYLRFFRNGDKRAVKGYVEIIVAPFEFINVIKGQVKIDAVELDTGKVARHDYKKPLPKWLEEPVARAMAAATNIAT